MNASDALHDIILPSQLNPWPPLLVWLLLAILLVALIALALWQWRRYRRLAPVRAAQKQLVQLRADDRELPRQVHDLLKRTAMSYVARERVAELSVKDWYDWLDQALPESQRGQWLDLMGNPYRRDSGHGGQALLNHARQTLPKLANAREAQC